MTQHATVPAIDGWFTSDADGTGDARLVGGVCTECSTVVFPPKASGCPNPRCLGTDFEDRPLSRQGRVYSYTTNHYAPPPPYVSPDPFEPYVVVAVELDEERMVVLGQAADGVTGDDLRVGQPVELTTKVLYTGDDGIDRTIWAWRPVAGADDEGAAASAASDTAEVTA